MSRIFRILLLTAIAAATAVPAAALTPDPFPAGACVRVSIVDRQPICVLVDPTS